MGFPFDPQPNDNTPNQEGDPSQSGSDNTLSVAVATPPAIPAEEHEHDVEVLVEPEAGVNDISEEAATPPAVIPPAAPAHEEGYGVDKETDPESGAAAPPAASCPAATSPAATLPTAQDDSNKKADMEEHSGFNMSCIGVATSPGAPAQPAEASVQLDEDQEWEVVRLLESRVRAGRLQCRAGWLGSPPDPVYYKFKQSARGIWEFHDTHPDALGPPFNLRLWLQADDKDSKAPGPHPYDNHPEIAYRRRVRFDPTYRP
ncbi:hypothetical protein MKZ38_008985 [Zalerion maritima]|uniref:Uncharacterized protein n=1 Tax=Zalerion maritima TaxID=339359 RepID=A0AAD5RGX7_9PEZI|nr:hypothetical protein MKZ38_008985 [Zalerion maritima]